MEKKPRSTARKVGSIITTILVIIIVLMTIMLMGARIVGLNVYTVVSGSMAPTFNVGDLIYVKKVAPQEIKVGDPITFVLNEDLVIATHRVIEIDDANQHFYTKGDNNDVADVNPVHYNNLIGKPVFKIPLLGYVSAWVRQPPGLYIAIAIAIVLLGLVFIPDLFRKAKQEKEEEALREAAEKKAAEEKAAEEKAAREKAERLETELKELRAAVERKEAERKALRSEEEDQEVE